MQSTSFWQSVLRWINLFFLFLGFGTWLSPYASLSCCWIFSFLGLIFPILLLVHIILVFIWLWRKHWYFIFSLAWIILSGDFVVNTVGIHSKAIQNTSDHLNVMTFNNANNLIFANRKGLLKEELKKLTDLFTTEDIDIIAFQEFPLSHYKSNRPSVEYIKKNTPLKYSYQQKGSALILFSKWPIKNGRFKSFGNDNNGFIAADINIHNKWIRIYNIHLQSNAVTVMANQVAKEKDFRNKETLSKVANILKKYRRTAMKRLDEVDIINQHIDKSPYPVVLLGDFNDVPQSRVYHLLKQNRNDAFLQSGSGLGFTFGGNIPALKIDYILSSPSITPLDCDIIKVNYSDHYPVKAILELEKVK